LLTARLLRHSLEQTNRALRLLCPLLAPQRRELHLLLDHPFLLLEPAYRSML
jgi:hypothetical protein